MTSTRPDGVLAERYGRPSPRRRGVLLAGVVVVVVAFGAWLGWTVWEQSRPSVASQLVGFDVVDSSSVTARVQLQFSSADVVASCSIKAYAADHTVVGELEFSPAASGPDVVSETIQTERPATSVELEGCTAPGQPRPR